MKAVHAADELKEAHRAIASLVGKMVKVVPKLRKGTAQHTLAVRRLKALRLALALIKKQMSRNRKRP